MESLSLHINKSIPYVKNSTGLNELENKYNETEQRLIRLLGNPDSIEYKLCYRKLKGLKSEIDQILKG